MKPDLLSFVCDAASAKQNKYKPGSHIPILSPDEILKVNPDFVLILPWNIAEEVVGKLKHALKSAKFVVAVPELKMI